MKTQTTIELPAKRYEDHDDCLAAAVADVARERGLEEWQCEARWQGGESGDREVIEVEVRE